MRLANHISRRTSVQQPRWIFYALPLFLMAMAFVFFSVTFETNDDVGMALLTSGTGIVSAPTGLLVFSSGVLVGAPLAALSSLLPSVPWYALYVSLAFLAAAFLFATALTRLNRSGLALALWALFLVGVGLPLCHRVHYTTAAFSLGLAAISLLWTGLSQDASPGRLRKDGALIIVTLLAAHAMRDRVTPMVFAFALATSLPLALYGRRMKYFLTVMSIAGLAIVVLERADRAYFDRPGWTEAREYDRLRAGITDYEYIPNYAQVGWNENDFRLFKIDFAWNESLFSIDKLRTLHRGVKENRPQRQSRWIRYLWYSNWNDPRTSLTGFVVFFALVSLCAMGAPRPMLISLAGGLLCVASAIGYLILSWRLPPWVFQALILMAAGQAIYGAILSTTRAHFSADKERFYPPDTIVFCGLVVLFAFSTLLLARERGVIEARQARVQTLREDLAALAPRTVFIWSSAWPFEVAPIFSRMADWVPGNAFWIGCYTRLPFNRERLAQFGGTDLYSHLLEKDVYVIAPRRPDIGERVTRFLAERENLSARAIRISGNEFYDLYRFEKK